MTGAAARARDGHRWSGPDEEIATRHGRRRRRGGRGAAASRAGVHRLAPHRAGLPVRRAARRHATTATPSPPTRCARGAAAALVEQRARRRRRRTRAGRARHAARPRRPRRVHAPALGRTRRRDHRQQRQDDHEGDARRDLRAAACRRRARVLKTYGNLNNLIGLPLTLLRLHRRRGGGRARDGHERAGRDRPPDRDRGARRRRDHQRRSRPSRGRSARIAGVAAAKGELFAGMRPRRGTIAVNIDDEWVVRVRAPLSRPPHRVRRRRARCAPRRSTTAAVDGIAFTLRIGARSAPVRAAHGRPSQRAERARRGRRRARARHRHRRPSPPASRAAEPPKMRMQVVRLANGVTLINDAYNANPASTEAALDAVGRMRRARHRRARRDARARRRERRAAPPRSARTRRRCGVAWLLAVGPQADDIAAGARARRRAPRGRRVCDDCGRRARRCWSARWQPGDTVLIKGSRGRDDEDGVRRYGARMAEVAALLEAAAGARVMLYPLLYPLHTTYSAFNVLRYITFRAVMAALTAFVVSFLLRPLAHPQAHRQPDRPADPPRRPASAISSKAGTPTMGGVLILSSLHAGDAAARRSHQPLRLAGARWSRSASPRSASSTTTASCSGRNSKGLPGETRLRWEFAIGLAAGAFLYFVPDFDTGAVLSLLQESARRPRHALRAVRRRAAGRRRRTRSTSPTASTAWRSAR